MKTAYVLAYFASIAPVSAWAACPSLAGKYEVTSSCVVRNPELGFMDVPGLVLLPSDESPAASIHAFQPDPVIRVTQTGCEFRLIYVDDIYGDGQWATPQVTVLKEGVVSLSGGQSRRVVGYDGGTLLVRQNYVSRDPMRGEVRWLQTFRFSRAAEDGLWVTHEIQGSGLGFDHRSEGECFLKSIPQ